MAYRYTVLQNNNFMIFSMWLLGIDTGGTFTDFVLYDGQTITLHKRLSTPQNPEQAILQGIQELGIPAEQLGITHGSTVATNAVLENKGVKTAYITNHGLGDTLTIGRQARQALYDLQPKSVAPPAPRALCFEVGGRLNAQGQTIEPLLENEINTLIEKIEQRNVQAVAINLLFSFLDEHYEKTIEAKIPKNIFVSRSSFILPQYKEYERGMTTWLNASVGPIVESYLQQLQNQLPQTKLSIMQSSGGTIAAEHAGKLAVHMLLSGPAGGLIGAQCVAAQSGKTRLLTFDMGGTSSDVSLIDGQPKLTSESKINNYPVAIPMVDIHTIGAGGGSLAWIDEGDMLQVGPQSAGAAPGPACYGQGGTQATVTDANLILGRLRSNAFLGGGMTLDETKARAAFQPLASHLNLSIEETALGVIQIANEHMAQALRVISIQRGLNPRHFTLVSFGGAGGLHVCALAEALDMAEALVPVHAGVLSALGMLASAKSRHLSKTVTGTISQLNAEQIENEFKALINQGCQALIEEGVEQNNIHIEQSLDVRYAGQSYTLNIPWQDIKRIEEDFSQAHHARYGHQLPLEVELVNLRVAVNGPQPELNIATEAQQHATEKTPTEYAKLYGLEEDVLICQRNTLTADATILGPAIITETISTTFIAPGWRCIKDKTGNLLLTRIM